jgi:hypothetical protein
VTSWSLLLAQAGPNGPAWDLGCNNKILLTGWLTNRNLFLTVLEAGKSNRLDIWQFLADREYLLGCVLMMMEGVEKLPCANSIMRAPPSLTTSKSPSPNANTLGLGL